MAEKGGGQDHTNAQPKKKGFIKLPFHGINFGSKPKETQQAEPDAHELHSRLGASPGHTPAGRRTSVPPSDESGESSMQPQRSQTFSGESPRTARPTSKEAKKLEKQRRDEEKKQEESRKKQEGLRRKEEERQEEVRKRQEDMRRKEEERKEELRKKQEEKQKEASRKRREELRKKQQKDAGKHSKTTATPKWQGHRPTSPTSKDRSLEAAPLSGSSEGLDASQLGERVVS